MKLELKNANTGVFHDLTHLIAHGGVKYASSQLTSSKSVTTMSGKVYRGLIREKDELSVSFISLTDYNTKYVCDLIAPEYFIARYYSPRLGRKVEKEVYVESKSLDYSVHYPYAIDGSSNWPVTSGENYSLGNGRYSYSGSLVSEATDYSNCNVRISCGFKISLASDITNTNYEFSSNGEITSTGATGTTANSKVTNMFYCPKGTDIFVTNATARVDGYVLAAYKTNSTSSFFDGVKGSGIAKGEAVTFKYTTPRDCYIRVGCRTTTSSTATVVKRLYTISGKQLVINYLDGNKSFLKNCYSGTMSKDYTVSESSIPVNAEYINISFKNADASKITVVTETTYWSKLSITLKER